MPEPEIKFNPGGVVPGPLTAKLATIPTGRPAETGGAAAAIGGLVALAAGVDDPGVVAAIVGAVGLVPAAVTGLINSGGIRGFVGKLWRGRHAE